MKKMIMYMTLGGAVTYAVTSYLDHNRDFTKAMKKMKKQNQKAYNWLKDKMN